MWALKVNKVHLYGTHSTVIQNVQSSKLVFYIPINSQGYNWTVSQHLSLSQTHTEPVYFIYLFGLLRRFQHCTGHITWVVGRAEETSTFSSLGFFTVNCRPTASNYQLSHLRPCRESNPSLRGGRRECYHSATMAPHTEPVTVCYYRVHTKPYSYNLLGGATVAEW